MEAKKKWKIHFIPQTHWDKEWYFTKYVSDIFLIDNIDKIYDIFKRNPNEFNSFVYDGQFSIIDDYLSYYPENEYKIKELVEAGKLILGPWYTQTDTFNAVGESIVRNLLVGTKNTQKYGKPMHIGYIPDSFGFNGNLPQILHKAGMQTLIHWRGVHSKHLKNGVFNRWKGIDGTIIPIYNLFKWGYGVGVGPSFERFKERWTLEEMPEQAKIYLDNANKKTLPVLKEVSQNTNGLILLPFGSDQLPIYDGLQSWINELNKIDQEHEWELSDYENFLSDLLNRNELDKQEIIDGELRFGQYSRAHKTITSSRYDIKKLVRELEYLIYEETEPLALIFEKMGGTYPKQIIEKNLKKLLESQAHDSLGGSNTDETNSTIVERLNAGIHAIESLNTLMKRRIAEAIELKQNQLMIYNLTFDQDSTKKKLWIFTKKPSFKIFDNDRELSYQVLNQKHINIEEFEMFEAVQIEDNRYLRDLNGQYWTEIILEHGKLPKLGYKTFEVVEQENIFKLTSKATNLVENEYYQLTVNQKTGVIEFNDKVRNQKFTQGIWLEADFDAGDLYDYSPSKNNPGNNAQFISLNSNVVEQDNFKVLTINYLFKVPDKLDSKNFVEQNLTLKFNLNDQLMNIDFEINNLVADIRWRILFETGIESKFSYADTSFGIIKRAVKLGWEMDVWESEKWQDSPIEIENMESTVWLKDQQGNDVTIFSQGNNEYQIIGEKDSVIAITLFRGVSAIGRRYMAYRPGRASGIDAYPHKTPLGNLNQELVVKLGLGINIGDDKVKQAKDWSRPVVYYQNQSVNQFHWKGDTFILSKRPLPNSSQERSFFNLELPKNLVVSAMKKAEDNNDWILRVYNPSWNEINWNNPNNLIEVNLLEEPMNQEINSSFKPNEVKTFRIEFNNEPRN